MTGNDQDNGTARARTGERNQFFLLTNLIDEHDVEIGKARVRNLSSTGMLAEGDIAVKKGARLKFKLGGLGELTGEVVRVDAGRIGIRFDEKVDPMLARRKIGPKDKPRPKPQLFRR